MRNIILSIFLTICLLPAFGAPAAPRIAETRGKDVAEDFSWRDKQGDKYSYRLLSMDGMKRTYYVKVGDFFAPIEASSARSLDSLFYSDSPNIVFYTRRVDGKDTLFAPVHTVNIGGEKEDVVICLAERDGSLVSNVIDISAKNLPAGVFAVVNLSNKPFGVSINKKLLRVEPFGIAKQAFAPSEEIEEIPFQFYILGKKPKMAFERYFSFATSQNLTLYVFDVPRNDAMDKEVPFLLRYGKPPRK
ncbi:MAG: hypothetical protein IKS15_02295 [Opitutales bacterium]|nr:hypothetical protein [Opitutales bacterium]